MRPRIASTSSGQRRELRRPGDADRRVERAAAHPPDLVGEVVDGSGDPASDEEAGDDRTHDRDRDDRHEDRGEPGADVVEVLFGAVLLRLQPRGQWRLRRRGPDRTVPSPCPRRLGRTASWASPLVASSISGSAAWRRHAAIAVVRTSSAPAERGRVEVGAELRDRAAWRWRGRSRTAPGRSRPRRSARSPRSPVSWSAYAVESWATRSSDTESLRSRCCASSRSRRVTTIQEPRTRTPATIPTKSSRSRRLSSIDGL